jgi:hypothetical protein
VNGQVEPWFVATERFTPEAGERWERWPYIVADDFMLPYFRDLDFLLEQLSGMTDLNLLCVGRNPPSAWAPPQGAVQFEFLGYDLVDVEGGASALTNCGGFPDVFDNAELSSRGLLTDHARAGEVQSALRTRHPEEPHARCHVWAIARAVPA